MKQYFSKLSGSVQSYAIDSDRRTSSPMKNFKPSFYIPLGVIALIVLALLVFAIRSASTPSTVIGDEDQRVQIKDAKATQKVTKNFAFPLKDDKGKEVSRLQYSLLDAELRDEIIVKGKRATSVQGRTFLILNIKITNSFDRTIQINTRDYVRLNVNGSSEKLAPEIHNDPVEIQADSTKYTRVGFPINDSDKDLTLTIGEINGKKETIKLNLQNK